MEMLTQCDDAYNVKIPMMPKGVEHPDAKLDKANARDVKIPMMPKGVEHSRT